MSQTRESAWTAGYRSGKYRSEFRQPINSAGFRVMHAGSTELGRTSRLDLETVNDREHPTPPKHELKRFKEMSKSATRLPRDFKFSEQF